MKDDLTHYGMTVKEFVKGMKEAISCKICGDEMESYMVKHHLCFVCWRNRNPYVELK